MGKSSVEHQIPDAASLAAAVAAGAASSKDRSVKTEGNNGGLAAASRDAYRASVASGVSAAVSSASREMFQGLFQDLGKQAMAMEAILRIVCGKVDSMETWMTEISFGMTELDLKLRNIAHNIEGTAGNVDDEATDVYRWAAPPAEDSAAAARAVATVKKKLGPNMPTVRMTGMVASIIDTLGVPIEERDQAAAATVSKPKQKRSLVAAVALKKVHKKKVGHQHQHHDKVKTPENAGRQPKAEPSEATNSNAVVGTQEVRHESSCAVHTVDESERSETAPVPQEQSVTDSEIESDGGGGESTDRSGQDSERSTRGTGSVPAVGVEGARFTPSQAPPQGTTESSVSTQPAAPADPPATSQHDAREQPQVQVIIQPDSDSHEAPPSVQHRDVPTAIDSGSAQRVTVKPTEVEPLYAQQASSAAAPQSSFESSAAPATSPPDQQRSFTSTAAATPQPSAQSARRATAIEASGYMSSPPHVAADPIALLPSLCSSIAAVAPPSVTAFEQASSTAASNTITSVDQPELSVTTSSDADVMESVVTAPPAKSNSRKASKAAVAVEQPARRASSRTKSQMVVRKFKPADISGGAVLPALTCSASSEPSTSAAAEHDAIHIADEQLCSSAIAAVPPPSTGAEGATDRIDAADADSSKDESESEDSASSSSESDDHSDSRSDSQDDDEENSEDTVACKSSKSDGPNATTMTHTITVLKKLKKANVLTADEEEELKQRAQEKWFKLKGHMKEKKKKDVANILLKRKKNVFTISARIELLEEKSKEVFAAIKQLTADLKTKVDGSVNESLRRQVCDINISLQTLDHRLTVGATPAMEKVTQLAREVDAVRSSFMQQLVIVSGDVASMRHQVAASVSEQHCQFEVLSQAFEQQLASLRAENEAKLRELPDHSAALEGIKRAVRRKADLKQLTELEARLLGHNADGEDCLVRCLSCHKEVVSTADTDGAGDAAADDERSAYMKKVNPGPSAGKIYRSNVPFSAQLLGAYESIPEDAAQTSDDAHFSELADVTTSAPTSTPKIVTARRDESSKVSGVAPPINSILIKASRAAMSPDRPISAPATALKKRAPYLKSKTLK